MTVEPEAPLFRSGYCKEADLLLGDIPVPESEPLAKYIAMGADEIDAALGKLYVTPLTFVDEGGVPLPEGAPGRLALKGINARIASGRFIMAQASAATRDEIHQYGLYLLTEAHDALRILASGDVRLDGAEVIPKDPETNDAPMLPLVLNVDQVSQVDAFYGMAFNGASMFIGRR